jgi:putative peptidoglycan lipid II flippase
MVAAIVAFVVNGICSIALMYPLKHSGLALATSIATAVNVVMLSIILKRKIGAFLDRQFYHSVFNIFLSSLVMLGIIIVIESILPWRNEGRLNERLLYLTLCVVAGMAAFFTTAHLTKCSEMTMIIDVVKRKLAPPKQSNNG